MIQPCRSGRHLRDDDDERDPRMGHRTCHACRAESQRWRWLSGRAGRGDWTRPLPAPDRHAAYARWSAGLDVAIRTLRLTEGHDGGAWQTLGEYLETEMSIRRSA